MFLVYIWLALGVLFTLFNRKFRLVIEREPGSGKQVLSYYQGNYLFQRLRRSLQLLGGERYEVAQVDVGQHRASRIAYKINVIRQGRAVLESCWIDRRARAQQIVEALQAFARDSAATRVEVSGYQLYFLLIAVAMYLFAAAAAVGLYWFELSNRID